MPCAGNHKSFLKEYFAIAEYAKRGQRQRERKTREKIVGSKIY